MKRISINKRIRNGVKRALQNQGETTVRLCLNTGCRNNRSYMGELTCNCKEIEIDRNGDCMWFTPKIKTESEKK